MHVVHAVADLAADAKKKPGDLNFGSAGIGSGTHINGERFKLAAGIGVAHIPYKGTPEALAVSSGKRASTLPNVPTIAESGLPGFDYNLWVAMFAPAGTPAEVVEKINRDVSRVLREPDVKERMTALGAEAMPLTAAEFDKFMRSEMDEAAKVVKAADIKVQ